MRVSYGLQLVWEEKSLLARSMDNGIGSNFFERFFIFSGPRGTQQKKLQNSDSIQFEVIPKDLHANIVL